MRAVLPYLSLLLAWWCLSSSTTATILRQSLDGTAWRVCNANGSLSLPARVPGVVHLDLLSAGLIGDSYARYNERAQAWV